jgi:diguanylate cyclase
VQERLQLASDLSTAIAQQQLMLQYQPVVDLLDGSIVGAEALVRWNHPKRGLIMPGEFVSVAEDNGLGLELGRWVMRTAISQMSQWTGKVSERFVLHINVSPIELRQVGLCDFVASLLNEYSVQPGSLALEVSETGLMTGDVVGLETLAALRSYGVRIEIDDFGVGYSSISYLRDLPIHTVKLDRSLIADIEVDQRQRRMAGAIFQLVEAVGLGSIVEGVETEGQAECLIGLGYRLAQGFLFAPGLSPDDLTELLGGGPTPYAWASPTGRRLHRRADE